MLLCEIEKKCPFMEYPQYKGNQKKIEKLKYNIGYQKIGEDFFIGGAFL